MPVLQLERLDTRRIGSKGKRRRGKSEELTDPLPALY